MERKRTIRIIVLVAILVVVAGVSVGFAVYTRVLNVTGNNITVNQGTNPFTSGLIWNTTGPTNSSVTGGTWTFNALSINPSSSAQNITYTANITNSTSYNAYLERSNPTPSGYITCTEVESGTTDSTTLANFCKEIEMTVTFGTYDIYGWVSTTKSYFTYYGDAPSVDKNSSKTVTVTVTIPANTTYPDGQVKVQLPDLTFEFTTIQGYNEETIL